MNPPCRCFLEFSSVVSPYVFLRDAEWALFGHLMKILKLQGYYLGADPRLPCSSCTGDDSHHRSGTDHRRSVRAAWCPAWPSRFIHFRRVSVGEDRPAAAPQSWKAPLADRPHALSRFIRVALIFIGRPVPDFSALSIQAR